MDESSPAEAGDDASTGPLPPAVPSPHPRSRDADEDTPGQRTADQEDGRTPPADATTSRAGLLAQRAGKTLVALLSVVVLSITWYGWAMLGNVNKGVATTDVFDDSLPPKPLDGSLDILLVGKDSRTDAQGDPLPREVLDKLHGGQANGDRQTDTMILVHIPEDGQAASAVSFPRDSWVELAGGYGHHKLNGAYVYAYNDTAESMRQKGVTDEEAIEEEATVAGRKNLIATIEKLIGRPDTIDRYAEVNLAGFYQITKALGGITVCLNEPVDDERSGANFRKGRQTISGVEVLEFVRQRYGLPRGDFDRIIRQQAFISALARKVLSQDVLSDPERVAALVDAVKKSVVLSEGWDLTEFAQQMQGLTTGNIGFHTIPHQGNAIIGEAAVVQVDEQRVRQFWTDLTAGSRGGGARPGGSAAPSTGEQGRVDPRAAEITVNVYNGSVEQGAGARALDTLTSSGFQRGELVQSSTRERSVIRFAPGERERARIVADALGGSPALEPDPDVTSRTVRVLLGNDQATAPSGMRGHGQLDLDGRAAQQDDPNEQPSKTPASGESFDASEIPCVN